MVIHIVVQYIGFLIEATFSTLRYPTSLKSDNAMSRRKTFIENGKMIKQGGKTEEDIRREKENV